MTLVPAVTTLPPPTNRTRRLLAPAAVASAIMAATAALQVVDPHRPGSWGVCSSVSLFGVYCPACGGLRAVHDLGHGHVMAAVSSNVLVVAAVPLVAVLMVRWVVAAWHGRRQRRTWLSHPVTLAALVVGSLVFAVVRNLAWGAWLAP